jgi:hypothetical protein
VGRLQSLSILKQVVLTVTSVLQGVKDTKAVYVLKTTATGAFGQHDTTEPIPIERKEIRTINGNLSRELER